LVCSNEFMTGHDTPLNLPPDDSDFSFDVPPSASPETPGNPVVPPLFLSPKEEKKADDHTPPGLSNPFWR